MGSPVNTISSRNLDNLLINGGMRFDQRRVGGLLTLSAGTLSTLYVTDRWRQDRLITSTTQTARSSLNPPPGFTHFLGLTVTAGASVTAAQLFEWFQFTEALTITPTKFGTAQAETLGLSFWVRSNITGTHSGSIRNNLGNRSYVFAYEVTTANTWEYKTIVIPGDTSGTWNLTNQSLAGMVVGFAPSVGTDYRTTAGSWQTGIFAGVTGGNNVTAVTGATFDLTGVQLNIGAPKPMILEPYADELQKCQRFYEKSYNVETAPGSATNIGLVNHAVGFAYSNAPIEPVFFKVRKRANGVFIPYSPSSGNADRIRNASAGTDFVCSGHNVSESSVIPNFGPGASASNGQFLQFQWAVDAEL